MHTRPSAITVKGILVPVGWASTGVITCLAVATFDEKEYRLAADARLGNWRDFLNQVVVVNGIPFEQDGCQWLSVLGININGYR